ncbi:MAG: 30S ribosomal protein S16 [Ignavibacteriales bacterium]|nr:30S ribosomal protein S16 [Ignavibacteriales bacterium]
MVTLRLRRVGKKKHPIYKVVATDRRAPRDGRYLEAVGSYDPNIHPAELKFKEERVFHWLRKGAQPTDTVRSLFRRSGLWLRWTLTKRGTDDSKKEEILQRWEIAQKDRLSREADRKARRAERKKKAAAEAVPSELSPAAPAPEPTGQDTPAAG